MDLDQITRLILSTPAGSPEWADVQYRLGICLSLLPGGDRQGNVQAAVEALQAAAQFTARQREEGRWLDLQLRLADLYVELFSWSGDLGQARAAEQIWRALVADPVSEHLNVVSAQLRLADLYSLIFQHDPLLETAEQAVTLYQATLKGLSKESQPFQWAMAHYSLGRLELSLYRTAQDEIYREEARLHFQSALEIFDDALFPSYYTSIQAYLVELD